MGGLPIFRAVSFKQLEFLNTPKLNFILLIAQIFLFLAEKEPLP